MYYNCKIKTNWQLTIQINSYTVFIDFEAKFTAYLRKSNGFLYGMHSIEECFFLLNRSQLLLLLMSWLLIVVSLSHSHSHSYFHSHLVYIHTVGCQHPMTDNSMSNATISNLCPQRWCCKKKWEMFRINVYDNTYIN